jgi:histidinol dehydrogenase
MTVPIIRWNELDEGARRGALRRPAEELQASVYDEACRILDAVRTGGDAAVARLSAELDGARPASLAVGAREFAEARERLTTEQREALARAIANVRRFHEAQRSPTLAIETSPGVRCERLEVPIDAVGLYVPAGHAPLPSTAIMLAVPAQIAGCRTRVLCTPPRRDGSADPSVVAAAELCGISTIFKVGGAQAIAAMAYGTESVPRVEKIFGPGNSWVTAAKLLVAQQPGGAACDLPAGPSEVLVIADDSARATFVAADLLAQAEHSPDAQSLLVTTSAALAEECRHELARQAAQLARRPVIEASLRAARIVLVADLPTAIEVSNAYAPEHLILSVHEPRRWLPAVRNAGSVFLGHWTPEPIGDYCSGTNHVLPTAAHARAMSGLALADFTKRITVQELTAAGLEDLGPVARTLALLEGLDAHAQAVTVRLDALAAGVRP